MTRHWPVGSFWLRPPMRVAHQRDLNGRRSKLREPWETMANLALGIIFLTASEGGDVRSYSRGGSDRPPKIGLRLGGQLPRQ